jgi:predicted  nucleic acid-binding Zn-ribbon protein
MSNDKSRSVEHLAEEMHTWEERLADLKDKVDGHKGEAAAMLRSDIASMHHAYLQLKGRIAQLRTGSDENSREVREAVELACAELRTDYMDARQRLGELTQQ